MINLTLESREVQHFLKQLEKTVLPKVTANALNKTAQSAKSVVIKTIAMEASLKQQDVRPLIALTRAYPKQLFVILRALSDKRLPLIRIDPRAKQGNMGVTYRSPKGPRLIPHAFLATMPSGHRGIYKRVGIQRLPIQELFGPSIAAVFKQPSVQAAAEKTVLARWPVCCEQALRFALTQRAF